MPIFDNRTTMMVRINHISVLPNTVITNSTVLGCLKRLPKIPIHRPPKALKRLYNIDYPHIYDTTELMCLTE